MRPNFIRKYSNIPTHRRLKEIFAIANLIAASPTRKHLVKMPIYSIQKKVIKD